MFNKKRMPTCVAEVMGTFNKTIEDLRNVEALQVAEAQRQEKVAAEAKQASAAAKWEAESAGEIAAKLSALVSPASATHVTNVISINKASA